MTVRCFYMSGTWLCAQELSLHDTCPAGACLRLDLLCLQMLPHEGLQGRRHSDGMYPTLLQAVWMTMAPYLQWRAWMACLQSRL